MFKSVPRIVSGILGQCPSGCSTLETITRVVTGVTHIDRVHFTEYEVSRSNPFWGAFRRFQQQDAPYAEIVTIVEIRYASHLSEAERRFVVCKELCHSLEAPDGQHVISNDGVDELVAAFSVYSSRSPQLPDLPAFGLEMMAEVSAVEVLCPHSIRKKRRANGGVFDAQTFAAEFGIPLEYAMLATNQDYMARIDDLIEMYSREKIA